MAQKAETEQAIPHATEFGGSEALIVSIRDPGILIRYPFVQPVRNAIICMVDYMIAKREHSRQPTLADLQPREILSLAQALGLEPNDREPLLLAYWLHKATVGNCQVASRGVKEFLDWHYPGQYETAIIGAHTQENGKLTHFAMSHEYALVKYNRTGTHIGTSPSNIFNFDDLHTEGNFTFPSYQGIPFQRDTHIIMGTYDGVRATMQEIEGPNAQWEEVTNVQRCLTESYPTVNEHLVTHVTHVTDFIRAWKDD